MDPAVVSTLFKLANLAGGSLIRYLKEQRQKEALKETIAYLDQKGKSLEGVYTYEYNMEAKKILPRPDDYKLYKGAVIVARILQEENDNDAKIWKQKALDHLKDIKEKAEREISHYESNISFSTTMMPGYSAGTVYHFVRHSKESLKWVEKEKEDIKQFLKLDDKDLKC